MVKTEQKKEIDKIRELYSGLPQRVKNYFVNNEFDIDLFERGRMLAPSTEEIPAGAWERYEYHKKRIDDLCKGQPTDYENSIRCLTVAFGLDLK